MISLIMKDLDCTRLSLATDKNLGSGFFILVIININNILEVIVRAKLRFEYKPTEKTDIPDLHFRLGQNLCTLGRMIEVNDVQFDPEGLKGSRFFEVDVAVSSSALDAITAMFTETFANTNCEVS